MTAQLLQTSFDEYRALPGWNWSTIKYAEKCIASLRAEQKAESKSTPDMQFGSDVHSAVLEPGDYQDRVTPARPGLRRGTNEWKDLDKEARAKGKRLIKHEDYTAIMDILSSLKQNKAAWPLLYEVDGISEGSVLWDDPATDLALKARVDRLLLSTGDGAPHLIDLKTAQDGGPGAFRKRLVSWPYMYLPQLAFYRRAVFALTGEKARCSIIVIEKSPGHPTGVYDLESSDLDLADTYIDDLLYKVREFELIGPPPSDQYPHAILEAPTWWRIKQQGATS